MKPNHKPIPLVPLRARGTRIRSDAMFTGLVVGLAIGLGVALGVFFAVSP